MAEPLISQDATDLIVNEEVGGQRTYTRNDSHFTWPGGASGPTVGIGYDLGYVGRQEMESDWGGIVPQEAIDTMRSAIGLTGTAARQFVQRRGSSLTIPWDQAMQEFSDREVPKWVTKVRQHLPNYDRLSPGSRGALVSLAYNRGPSFDAPGTRFAEMRAIKQHMSLQQYALIPDDFRSMKRLWIGQGLDGLLSRRDSEATLFERGLTGAQAATPAGALTLEERSSATILQKWLNVWLASVGKPLINVDGDIGEQTDGATLAFQQTHNLNPDSVAGPRTRLALKKIAVPGS